MLTNGNRPFLHLGNNTGCLLVHGFTGAPHEVEGLGGSLAARGFTVLGVRLSGHGTRVEDMNRSRWRDWAASVEDGYWQLRSAGKRVVPMGLSLGGALVLNLASSLPVDALVAMSAPVRIRGEWDWRLARWLHPFWPVRRNPAGTENTEMPKGMVAYDALPLRAAWEMDLFLDHLRAQLPRVTAPALIIHSRSDRSVPPENGEAVFRSIASAEKTILRLERSGHIVTEDVEREQVWQACAEWAGRRSGL